ncbi:hypothetical protein BCR44DRAFT_196479 [Catenaria anguillulae PL171]|uniref:Uncharacterized protein n=1 Tax=Catenaria anguillulae PL171 TaxID=765915 RepID=A0A1Y2HRP4_9FUNG|nr:hypothetical protein BCR44DRAFT_196479 [Catenaria anguillulae PL171]
MYSADTYIKHRNGFLDTSFLRLVHTVLPTHFSLKLPQEHVRWPHTHCLRQCRHHRIPACTVTRIANVNQSGDKSNTSNHQHAHHIAIRLVHPDPVLCPQATKAPTRHNTGNARKGLQAAHDNQEDELHGQSPEKGIDRLLSVLDLAVAQDVVPFRCVTQILDGKDETKDREGQQNERSSQWHATVGPCVTCVRRK